LYELYCKLGKNQIIAKYFVKRFCCGMWCHCVVIVIGMEAAHLMMVEVCFLFFFALPKKETKKSRPGLSSILIFFFHLFLFFIDKKRNKKI